MCLAVPGQILSVAEGEALEMACDGLFHLAQSGLVLGLGAQREPLHRRLQQAEARGELDAAGIVRGARGDAMREMLAELGQVAPGRRGRDVGFGGYHCGSFS